MVHKPATWLLAGDVIHGAELSVQVMLIAQFDVESAVVRRGVDNYSVWGGSAVLVSDFYFVDTKHYIYNYCFDQCAANESVGRGGVMFSYFCAILTLSVSVSMIMDMTFIACIFVKFLLYRVFGNSYYKLLGGCRGDLVDKVVIRHPCPEIYHFHVK